MTAFGPIALPTINLVNGIRRRSKTTNGNDLIKFIIISKIT